MSSKLKSFIEEKAKELYQNLDKALNLPDPIDTFADVNLIPWLADQLENILKEIVKEQEEKSEGK
mgnify:CR=1 FL=1